MRNVSAGLSHEDPLTYLPRKPVQEYAKGRVIYDGEHLPNHLYVIILGRVKIINTADDGCHTVGRIAQAEDFFGESCLVAPTHCTETATALDDVILMSWSRADIEAQIEREPRLGIALSQYFVRQCLELQDRIESMAVHKTPERVMLALLQLGSDLGVPTSHGALRVPSLTHNTIAEFVGTTREIVSLQMNRLRRLGLISYSRNFIDVYASMMRQNLKQQGMSIPRGMDELAQRGSR